MNIFKEYAESSFEVFRNIKYLDPECIPREFHYRDHEMATIASNISPLFYGSVPVHTVILGDNATGKTTAIKKLFEDIREPLPEVIPVYINCRKHHTEYKIYAEIYRQVTGKEAPQRGSNSQKLFTEIMETLEQTHQPLLIALDDMNYLLGPTDTASPHSQNVIRNLTRANESYHIIIGIYPIITNKEFKYKFDREVTTLFIPSEVHFKPYTTTALYHIIRERCNYVFQENTITDEIIKTIIKHVQKENNLRKAWTILKKLGLQMKKEERKATPEMLEKILK